LQQLTPPLFLKVIDETLRLVSISFVSFREATKDVFVNGVLD
jgi:ent-kaurenoic acid hydroxylase